MSTPRIIRLAAHLSDGEQKAGNYRLFLLCGIQSDGTIAAGEWMGYTHNNNQHWPFLLRRSPVDCLFFGTEEDYWEPTDLLEDKVFVGRRFKVSSSPNEVSSWSCEYRVTSILEYAACQLPPTSLQSENLKVSFQSSEDAESHPFD